MNKVLFLLTTLVLTAAQANELNCKSKNPLITKEKDMAVTEVKFRSSDRLQAGYLLDMDVKYIFQLAGPESAITIDMSGKCISAENQPGLRCFAFTGTNYNFWNVQIRPDVWRSDKALVKMTLSDEDKLPLDNIYVDELECE